MNNSFFLTTLLLFICISLINFGCSKKEPANSTGQEPAPRTEKNLSEHSEKVAESATFSTIEWTDLLPDDDLQALENPPAYLADIQDGSEADQINSQLKAEGAADTLSSEIKESDERYQQALVSKEIRPEFNGRHVRVPGFIVPLEFNEHQIVTTFFLVPWFGACLHLPPPPPNQIIYAVYESGIKLESFYDPFWISGRMSTTLFENDLAAAAYSITVSSIEPYYEDE